MTVSRCVVAGLLLSMASFALAGSAFDVHVGAVGGFVAGEGVPAVTQLSLSLSGAEQTVAIANHPVVALTTLNSNQLPQRLPVTMRFSVAGHSISGSFLFAVPSHDQGNSALTTDDIVTVIYPAGDLWAYTQAVAQCGYLESKANYNYVWHQQCQPMQLQGVGAQSYQAVYALIAGY